MNERQFKKWERNRKLGKFGFILVYSFLTSLICAAVASSYYYLWDKFVAGKEAVEFDVTRALIRFTVFFAVFAVVAFFVWKKSEKDYLAALNK